MAIVKHFLVIQGKCSSGKGFTVKIYPYGAQEWNVKTGGET